MQTPSLSPLPEAHEADQLAEMRAYISDEEYLRVLRFIRRFDQQYKYAPLAREIAEGCHLSRTKTDFILYVMRSYGKIAYIPYIPRSLTINDEVAFP